MGRHPSGIAIGCLRKLFGRVSSHPSWPERPISLCGSLVTCDVRLVRAVFWQRDGESVGCDPRLNRLGGMMMMMDVPKWGVRSIDQWHSTLLPIDGTRLPLPCPPPPISTLQANRDPPPSFWFKTRQTKQKSHSAENERARPKHAQGGKRIKNSPRASQGGGGDRERESNARPQMSRGVSDEVLKGGGGGGACLPRAETWSGAPKRGGGGTRGRQGERPWSWAALRGFDSDRPPPLPIKRVTKRGGGRLPVSQRVSGKKLPGPGSRVGGSR